MEKALILRKEAKFIDEYTDNNGERIFVYYLNGFFIEAVTNVGVIIDVVPYKRGYKVNKDEQDNKIAGKEIAASNLAA
jgi:hypothetical protein